MLQRDAKDWKVRDSAYNILNIRVHSSTYSLIFSY